MKLASIAFRNIRRNRRRSLLSGTAIAVATMAITFLFSYIDGFVGDYESNVVRYMTGHVRIRNVEYDENEQLNPLHLSVADYDEVVRAIESEAGVAAVVPRTRFFTAIYHTHFISEPCQQSGSDFPLVLLVIYNKNAFIISSVTIYKNFFFILVCFFPCCRKIQFKTR